MQRQKAEKKWNVSMESWVYLRVQAHRSDEGAEEGLSLGVASGLQQWAPVLRAGNHLALQAAVPE